MASFTRDWDESNPTDNTYAYEIDEYNRYLRVDCSDRLKSMVYGFTLGENDGLPGFKKLIFKQQSAAAATPNADEIVLYSIDDGSNCGLYAKEENGNTKQVVKYDGSSLILNVADGDGCVMKTGAQTIAGVKTFSDQPVLTGGLTSAAALVSTLATGTAPLTVASTTKVTNLNADTVDGYDVATYSGGESATIAGGLIIKGGVDTTITGDVISAATSTITFAAAFPNNLVAYSLTVRGATTDRLTIVVSAASKSAITYYLREVASETQTVVGVSWIAIGN